MTSLDSEPQVDDQTVIMEDVSVPILTDQEKCAMLTSLEKQCRVLSARKDYVTDMTEIENAIPSKTEDVRQQLEEEAANLDEKIKFLEGKMSVLLPCPVPLCKHNFKYKSNRKRMAELIIKPAKLNPKLNPKIAKTEENKTNDFKIPRKTAKTVPVEINTKIPTNNSFAALNTANKDAEEVITPKIRPIMMKLFNNYNLVLQNLHKTHPTATNTHVGGYIKIQAENETHHREITKMLTEKNIQYYAIDPPENRPLKLVIKGLLATTQPEEIKADLISKGVKIEKVAQLRQFQTKSPLPIYTIEITRDENVEDIYKIRSQTQKFRSSADNLINDLDMDTAYEPTEMELSKSPTRTPSPPLLPPCEQLRHNKAQLKRMMTFRKHKAACIQELQAMPDHHPEDPFYARAATELQDIEEAIQLAASDIDSFPPCVTPGCPHHENNSPPASPNRKENNQTKRKDLSEFEFPPLRKTARKINLDLSQSVDDNLISTNKFALPDNNLENPGLDSQTEIDQEEPTSPAQNRPAAPSNQNAAQDTPTLPPPVMLKITDHIKNHMNTIMAAYPKLRSRLTGEYIKLYSDSFDQRRSLIQFLKAVKFQFY
ncbi:uncharacterized protein TNCT_140381, partial [Trichonephila clavata]